MLALSQRPAAFWGILITGAVVTDITSLSVHVGMLQGLGVPFPDRTAVSPVAALLNTTLSVLALMVFYDLARDPLKTVRPWIRWLIVAALFGMLKEALRGNLMNAVVTTAWTFSAAQALSPVIYSVVLGGLVVLVTPRLRQWWLKLVAAFAIAALMTFAVRPICAMLLSPLMASLAHLDHDDVYPFPYGWHVLPWAYVTYLEPVFACIAAAALVWPHLNPRIVLRVVQFTTLIMLIKGALIPTFVFSLFAKVGVAGGMLSESQFMLEALVLGLVGAITWQLAEPRHRIARRLEAGQVGR